jgi:hypothetical protein
VKSILRIFLSTLLLILITTTVFAQSSKSKRESTYSIRLTVLDSLSGQTTIGATCQIKELGVFAVTDVSGLAIFKNIPAGEAKIDISYLGYESVTKTINVTGDLTLKFKLIETSLKLKEVNVVAKSSAAGSSTASKIGRQAIDHLQATNLGDLMQLIPGQIMQSNDLTTIKQVQIRSIGTGDNNNSYGASIIVDGVPVSNNANFNDKTGINATTATSGIDLRQIGADNIESVEVIRGIPSAEYGDLTSGAIIVKSKSGKTPFEVKTKVNPTTINSSVGKGWSLGDKNGFLNTNFDYAQAWGDPRQKTSSFDRFSGSIAYSNTFFKKWKTNTKVSINTLLDWRGQDPDVIATGTATTQGDFTLQVNHEGKFALNLPLCRTLSYVTGFSTSRQESTNSTIVSNSSGLIPILTASQTGYYDIPFKTTSYYASGGTVSTPQSYYFKVANTFGAHIEKFTHQFNLGLEYRYEQNKAIGYYNNNDSLPLRPNSDGRPRPYYDIPPLNQLSGFIEDKMEWKIWGKSLKLQAGLRYTCLQPGMQEQVWSLSPRLNASIELAKWIEIRGAYGQNAKTPGMQYLYPEKKYMDRLAADNTAATNPAEKMLLYYTNIYDVKRTLGLQNATDTKVELGFDIKLPENRRISIICYWDQTPNGFGNYSEYYTYLANFYTMGKGLTANPGAKPTIDLNNPTRVDTVYSTTGKVGNTQWADNKGVEFDFDLGRIKEWNTSFYLTGAYMETSTKTTGPNTSNPNILPFPYHDVNTPPFKYLYPSGQQVSVNRRLSSQLRAVVNIPSLSMVLSTNLQVIWYSYSETANQSMNPIGYFTANTTGGVDYHVITQDMLNDPNYKIKGLLLSDSKIIGNDNPPITNPPIWLMSTRLTKDISKIAGFSFYVNNTFFYEPWQHSSASTTLTQGNIGTFSFGMELYFKL